MVAQQVPEDLEETMHSEGQRLMVVTAGLVAMEVMILALIVLVVR
jgi:hypothetical protein